MQAPSSENDLFEAISQCRLPTFYLLLFVCLLQKTRLRSLRLAKSNSRMGQAAAAQLTPRGKSIHGKPPCTLAIVARNLQSSKLTKQKTNRPTKQQQQNQEELQGAPSPTQKRQTKRSKVTQKHEEQLSIFPRGFQEVGAALKGSTNKCEGKCRNFYSSQSRSVILLLLNFPIAHRRHNRAQLTLLCQVPFLARAVHGSNRMLNP